MAEKPPKLPPPSVPHEFVERGGLGGGRTERKVLSIDAVQWVCPFCEKHNGIPEVDVCACGAERVDEIASRE